jgi:hypothetical protein
MQVRHILGFVVFCGAVSVLGGQGARAQSPSSSFVQMLLLRESKAIGQDQASITLQNKEVQALSVLLTVTPVTPRVQSKKKALENQVVALQRKIDKSTSSLTALQAKLTSAVASLGNPSTFAQQAARDAAIIAAFAARPRFGLPPATGTQ